MKRFVMIAALLSVSACAVPTEKRCVNGKVYEAELDASGKPSELFTIATDVSTGDTIDCVEFSTPRPTPAASPTKTPSEVSY